jgi:drug/metabolite transporter (DMT)-like permease
MEAHARHTAQAWIGMILIVAGLLVLLGAYFLLPLYSTTLNCFDICEPPKSATMWEFSLRLLANLAFFPIANTVVLALLHLPLLAATVSVGYSIAYRAHMRRTLAAWSKSAWVIGVAALILMLPVLLLGSRPDWGYLGMLIGYGMLWIGNRLLLTTPPLSPVAA